MADATKGFSPASYVSGSSIVNLAGPVFNLTPEDTPFLTAIGQKGYRVVQSPAFTWQTETNATADGAGVAEGKDPSFTIVAPSEVINYIQIFQLGVEMSYMAQSSNDMLGVWSTRTWAHAGENPIVDKTMHQLLLRQRLQNRNIEYAFLRGTAVGVQTDTTTVRKTQGILGAVTTNTVDASSADITVTTTGFINSGDKIEFTAAHGLSKLDEVELVTAPQTQTEFQSGGTYGTAGTHFWVTSEATAFATNVVRLSTSYDNAVAGTGIELTGDSSGTQGVFQKCNALSKTHVDRLLLKVFNAGSAADNLTFVLGGHNKQRLSNIYGYAPESRTVGGVNIQQVETDFGRVGVIVCRAMPTDDVLLADLSELTAVAQPVPGKGAMFAEPVARTGSADRWQVYAQMGLQYGAQQHHGKITSTTTAA